MAGTSWNDLRNKLIDLESRVTTVEEGGGGGEGSGSGGVTHLFKARMTSDQVIANFAVPTVVKWDVAVHDTDSNLDLANNKFVAPVDGIYSFGLRLFCSGNSSSKTFILTNTSSPSQLSHIHSGIMADAEDTSRGLVGTTDVQLSQGDEVYVVGFGSAVEMTLDAQRTPLLYDNEFWGKLLKDLSS